MFLLQVFLFSLSGSPRLSWLVLVAAVVVVGGWGGGVIVEVAVVVVVMTVLDQLVGSLIAIS